MTACRLLPPPEINAPTRIFLLIRILPFLSSWVFLPSGKNEKKIISVSYLYPEG
jgi:hypothetical protein